MSSWQVQGQTSGLAEAHCSPGILLDRWASAWHGTVQTFLENPWYVPALEMFPAFPLPACSHPQAEAVCHSRRVG